MNALQTAQTALRAAAYARFSSEMQRDESIDAQLRAIRAYCEKNGLLLVHECSPILYKRWPVFPPESNVGPSLSSTHWELPSPCCHRAQLLHSASNVRSVDVFAALKPSVRTRKAH